MGGSSCAMRSPGRRPSTTCRRSILPDVVCILSDINMPGITGLDLLKAVKEKYPNIRVSMITAYGDEHNFKTAMSTGAEHYFTKPIDFDAVKRDVLNNG